MLIAISLTPELGILSGMSAALIGVAPVVFVRVGGLKLAGLMQVLQFPVNKLGG